MEFGLSETKDQLAVRLYGPFSATLIANTQTVTLGAKPSALLALLATAPDGSRTRSWIQEVLWERSGPEHGRSSLRQALSALRKSLSPNGDALIQSNNNTITLNLDRVELIGEPKDGEFLEGLDIAGADRFSNWVKRQRRNLITGYNPEYPLLDGAIAPINSRMRSTIAIMPLVGSVRSGAFALGDLVSADISRKMSRAVGIDVISHLSCRQPTFRETEFHQLSAQYNVDYLVTGHLRERDDMLLSNIDVLEVSTGKLVGTENFETSKSAILRGEPDHSDEIIRFLTLTIFDVSVRAAVGYGTRDTASHTLLMSSISLMHRQELISFAKSREQLEELQKRLPGSAEPLAWLAKWYVLFISQGWSTNISGDAGRAKEYAENAVSADVTSTLSRTIDGLVEYQLLKNYDAAKSRFHEVLDVDSNNPLAWLMTGKMHAFEADGASAVACTNRAQHLSPLDPSAYLFATLSATAHLANKDYEIALELSEKAIQLNRNHISSLRAKIVALHELGRVDEARDAAAELMKREPDLTISRYLSNHAAANYDSGQAWARALNASGVPLQ